MHLNNVISKANDINIKQAHFKEYKPTSFDRIMKQQASFMKYVDLWTFISDKWNTG